MKSGSRTMFYKHRSLYQVSSKNIIFNNPGEHLAVSGRGVGEGVWGNVVPPRMSFG
jgi:hypothetical protein